MVALAPRRVGISQGRLVPSRTGELQCSPRERWPEEFRRGADLGIAHIELLVERDYDPANPMWSDDGRAALLAEAAVTGVGIGPVCVDLPLEQSLPVIVEEIVDNVVPAAAAVGTPLLVVALMEASELRGADWAPMAAAVRAIADAAAASGKAVALETLLPPADVDAFLAQVDRPNVGACFDLGNTTALGYDVPRGIRLLGPQVIHVHLKDKDRAGNNVRFGTGATDFAGALAALNDVGYDSAMTMEATRGDDPVQTAREHLAFLHVLPGWS